jgi:ATP-dependent Lon protease
MTGELTLTGVVLPVGGIREKVIAARRVGIRELILPEGNRKDVEELPRYLREGYERALRRTLRGGIRGGISVGERASTRSPLRAPATQDAG